MVNTDNYQQGISVHRCQKNIQGGPCKYAGSPGIEPEKTECRQLKAKLDLLSVGSDGSIVFDTFPLPSVCACHIDNSFF